MTNLFGMTKKDALQKGMQIRNRFLEVVQKLPEFKDGDKYPHKFIYGHPGVGKSYEITNHLDTSNTKYVLIS